jgi:hypothetical protein
MEMSYFFGIGGETVGPLDTDAIRQHIRDGRINKATLAWHQGMAEWQPVDTIAELKDAFGELLETQGGPPPLPPQSAPTGAPPPLPEGTADTGGPTDRSAQEAPAGLSELERSAYRLVMWGFRSRRLREYVQRNPRKALHLATATILVLVLLGISLVSEIMDTYGTRQTAQPVAQRPMPRQLTPQERNAIEQRRRIILQGQQDMSRMHEDANKYRQKREDKSYDYAHGNNDN